MISARHSPEYKVLQNKWQKKEKKKLLKKFKYSIFAVQNYIWKHKPKFLITKKKKKKKGRQEKEEYLLNEKCMAYLSKHIFWKRNSVV